MLDEMMLNTMTDEEVVTHAETYNYEDMLVMRLCDIANWRRDMLSEIAGWVKQYEQNPKNFDLEDLFRLILDNCEPY